VADLDGDAQDGATRKALAYLQDRAAYPEQPFALCVNYINPHDIYHFKRMGKREQINPPSIPVPRPASWTEDFAGKPAPQRRFMTEDQGEYMLGKPDVFWERYREFYREKCRLVDGQVGRVLDRLEALGLHDNTIVVYVSDHGDMDTNHRLIYKGPFMYEHLVRVPLMVRVPKAIGGVGPQELDEFALQTDILPTLCDFAGADPGLTDGFSLRGALTRARPMPSRDYVVSEYFNKQKWVNPIRMIRTRAFKYNRYLEHGEELYDLENDPHELVNLAHDPGFRKQKDELATQLREWRAAQGDTAFDTYWPTNRDGTRYDPHAASIPLARRRRPISHMRPTDTVT